MMNLTDVFFRPLSNDKVLCFGAKPSEALYPEKLLQLIPKVMTNLLLF